MPSPFRPSLPESPPLCTRAAAAIPGPRWTAALPLSGPACLVHGEDRGRQLVHAATPGDTAEGLDVRDAVRGRGGEEFGAVLAQPLTDRAGEAARGTADVDLRLEPGWWALADPLRPVDNSTVRRRDPTTMG